MLCIFVIMLHNFVFAPFVLLTSDIKQNKWNVADINIKTKHIHTKIAF